MGILDDVIVNAKSAAKSVGEGAGKLMDISKLKVTSAELSGEISGLYKELGKYVCDNACDALPADGAAIVARIKDLKAQLDSVNTEILTKQNKKVCPTCGHTAGIENVFCSVCGAKLPEAPVAEAEPEVVEPETPAAPEAPEAPESPTNQTEE